MQEVLRSVRLDIDLSVIRDNLAKIREMAGDRELIASVKANAYGFGVVAVCRELVAAGVKKLWTGDIDEAIELRRAGVDAEILVFGGQEPSHFEVMLRHELQPTVFDHVGVDAAVQGAKTLGVRAPIWVKVDAGLGRLGVPIKSAVAFIDHVSRLPELDLRGIYTHLPFSSPKGKRWALERYRIFDRCLDDLAARGIRPAVSQAWGSSGVLAQMPDATNAVCVGHSLFGLSPFKSPMAAPSEMRSPIHSLSASIVNLVPRSGASAASSDYGGSRAADGFTATVAIGLRDGLKRASAGQALAIVRNQMVPITGVTLEHLMLDVGEIERPPLFERAILIGGEGKQSISLNDWASWTRLSPLELMMSLSGRSTVRYRNGRAVQ